MGITVDCGPIKFRVKHLFGSVVWAMMSPGGSILASLENVNGFLAVNTPPNDLIRTDSEQEGVFLKVMFHIFKEFVLLLGRHPFHKKVPRMDRTYGKINCIAHKLKGEVLIGGNYNWCFSQFPLKCFKSFNTLIGEEERGILLKKMGHQPGYLRKVLYESSIEAGMTKETTDTLDGSGMRQRLVSSHRLSILSKWERQVPNEFPKTEKSSIKTSIVER
nr:hypothetical protein [Tanacetum cinerariifolium]